MIEVNGSVVSVERFRIDTDGEGISTLVALYRCRLKCTYCANRECKMLEYKRQISAEQLVKILMKDALYYRATNGAIVFGGGEPLLQSAFVQAVCEGLDKAINIRIETSLNDRWEKIEKLIDYVDKWIIDIKDVNPKIYKSYTGEDNARVLKNLDRLIKAVGKEKIHLRVPRIKNYNNEKDVANSVETIRNLYDIEPEVFDYKVVETRPAKNKTQDETTESADDFLNRIMKPKRNAYEVSPEAIDEYIKNKKSQNIMSVVSSNKSKYEWVAATYNGVIMAEWEYQKYKAAERIQSLASLLERYSLEEIEHLEWYQGEYLFKERYEEMLKEHPDKCYLTIDELEEGDYKNYMLKRKSPIEFIKIDARDGKKEIRQTKWSSHLSFYEPDGTRSVKIISDEDGYEGSLARDYYIKKVLRIVNGMIIGTQYENSSWKIHRITDDNVVLTKSGPDHYSINLTIDDDVYYKMNH